MDLYPVVLGSVSESINSDSVVVDNFYLDMTGIIHTCTHSNDDKLIPLNEQEMFLRIFAYTDRLYKLVRPKRLIFLAVDGVAPRAKMNQQRSRRFRASKEREALLAEHILTEGCLPDTESFDSNCITPGTDFMHRLGEAFRRWIAYKMQTDPFWRSGAEVVFSGPDVPGEGEHKVMDMIRAERAAQGETYRPGQLRHCMYGLDADLIMLSLVTHEPCFTLLREKIVRGGRPQGMSSSGRGRSRSVPPLAVHETSVRDVLRYTQEDFEMLEVSVLRHMFAMHFGKLEKAMNSSSSDSSSMSGDNNVGSTAVPAPKLKGSGIGLLKKKRRDQPAASSPPPALIAAAASATLELTPMQVAPLLKHAALERGVDDFVFM